MFTDLDANQDDYMYIESKLADLVPVLKGSPERQVTWEEDILIDASESFDPAEGLSEIASIDLVSPNILNKRKKVCPRCSACTRK